MKIVIPSYKRPGKMKIWQQLPEELYDDIYIFVRKEELSAYEEHYGLDCHIVCVPESVVNLHTTRAYIGQYCEENNIDAFLMFDDDLKFFYREDMKLKPITPIKFMEMYNSVAKQLESYSHVSISGRYMNNTVKQDMLNTKMQTQATAYRTEDYVRIEHNTPLMEDLNRTLSLFYMGLDNIMIYNFAIDPGKTNSPGGCSTFRTWDVHKQAQKILCEKFHECVKPLSKNSYWEDEIDRPDVRVQWKKALLLGKEKEGIL